MEYRYCENENFEDLSSGRVIYGNSGIPNFPVRLGNEIFRRCLEYTPHKNNLTVYDPCCGGAYLLTVLGFCNADVIRKVVGSDIDEKMMGQALKNTSLLTKNGLHLRKQELIELRNAYQKQSHIEALESVARLEEMLHTDMQTEIFQGDCTREIEHSICPDVIITDVPYGNLVDWQGNENSPMEGMMKQLARIAQEETVLAVIMDKKTKITSPFWKRVEKQVIGKRKFEIFVLASEVK